MALVMMMLPGSSHPLPPRGIGGIIGRECAPPQSQKLTKDAAVTLQTPHFVTPVIITDTSNGHSVPAAVDGDGKGDRDRNIRPIERLEMKIEYKSAGFNPVVERETSNNHIQVLGRDSSHNSLSSLLDPSSSSSLGGGSPMYPRPRSPRPRSTSPLVRPRSPAVQ